MPPRAFAVCRAPPADAAALPLCSTPRLLMPLPLSVVFRREFAGAQRADAASAPAVSLRRRRRVAYAYCRYARWCCAPHCAALFAPARDAPHFAAIYHDDAPYFASFHTRYFSCRHFRAAAAAGFTVDIAA